MKKWLIGAGVVAFVAYFLFMALRDTQRLTEDWKSFAGQYVAASGSYQAKADDVLELRADGTWTHSRGERTIDEGGKATGPPDESDLKNLNWLGPNGTSDCLGSVEGHCPDPTFRWKNADLVYVPEEYQQTTNKGDWETDGDYYRVTKDGDVLVDEDGVKWVRKG